MGRKAYPTGQLRRTSGQAVVELAHPGVGLEDFRRRIAVGKGSGAASGQLEGHFLRVALGGLGQRVEMVDRCSCVDGTWGLKARFHDLGVQTAAPMLNELKSAQAAALATDCPMAGLRMTQAGLQSTHPLTLLRRAYGLPEASAQ